MNDAEPFNIADTKYRPVLFKRGINPNSSRPKSSEAAILDQSMTPYVLRTKPKIVSPRTANGHSKRKVERFLHLVNANRQANQTVLKTGSETAQRKATAEERLQHLMTDEDVQALVGNT